MNESEEAKDKFCKWEKKQIHWRYITAILAAIVILILSFKFQNNEALLNIVNFTVGITSVILAVVAIVYAFLQGRVLEGSVSNINSASNSIKSETVMLNQSLKNVLDVVGRIPERLNQIDNRLEMIASKPAVELKEKAPQAPPDEKVQKFADEVIERFMTSSSWNGIKLLYLCFQAANKNVTFDLRDYCANDPQMSFDYAYGFLIASASAGFVYISDANGMIKVNSMPPLVSDKLTKTLTIRIPLMTNGENQIKMIEYFVSQKIKAN
jgi:hypothetical protein